MVPSRLNFILYKSSPVNGVHSQKLQQTSRSPQRADLLGSVASRKPEGAFIVSFHLLKAAALSFPIDEIRVRSGRVRRQATLCGGPQPHQPAGIREGQRPQQKSVDHAENRRVGADAE